MPRSVGVLSLVLAVLALGLLAQAIAPLSLPPLRAAALTLGLAVAIVYALAAPVAAWQALLAALAWGSLWVCTTPPQLLLCLAAMLGALAPAKAKAPAALWSFAMVLAAIDVLYHASSPVAGLLERVTPVLVGRLSLTGPLSLGWYASGLPVLIACFAAMAAAGLNRRSLVAALALIVVWLVYINLRGRLPLHDLGDLYWWQAGWVAVAGVVLVFALRSRRTDEPPPRRPRLLGVIGVAAALLAGLLCSAVLRPPVIPPYPSLRSGQALRVGLWHGDQVGTWRPSDWQHLGIELNSAHFGALSAYLRALGWEPRDLGPEVTPKDLTDLDVALVVTPRRLSDATVAAFHDFVRRGGGLLVAGDHTDMFGIRGPINRLLGPSGIILVDDTALHLREGWQGSFNLIGDAWWLSDRPAQTLAYGVGASLQVPSFAQVLAVGQAALADGPNPAAKDTNRLGNYAYDPGERLGGLPLIASARVGRGSITAWGDTSPLQTLSLHTSLYFCRHMIALAARPARPALPPAATVVLLVLLVVAIIASAASGNSSRAVAPLLIAAFLGLAATGPHRETAQARQALTGRLALVDVGHANGFDARGVSGDSIDGLFLGLLRAGYVPLAESGAAFRNLLAKADLAAVIAPAAPFSAPEVAALGQMMSRGGTLLLACGWRERPTALPLLSALGMDLRPVPLGPVPYLDESPPGPWQSQQRFCDAWPLNLPAGTRASALYETEVGGRRWVLVAQVPVGRGRAIVIADPGFFTDRNFEARTSLWEPNLRFFRSLLSGRPQ
jgi:hypothetical protein